eukprot:5108677-Prymnesium_polylepis.1
MVRSTWPSSCKSGQASAWNSEPPIARLAVRAKSAPMDTPTYVHASPSGSRSALPTRTTSVPCIGIAAACRAAPSCFGVGESARTGTIEPCRSWMPPPTLTTAALTRASAAPRASSESTRAEAAAAAELGRRWPLAGLTGGRADRAGLVVVVKAVAAVGAE